VRSALPVLGVDGTLAGVLPKDSPAYGKVQAKTGTYIDNDLLILHAARTGSSSNVWKLSVNRVAICSLYLVCKPLRQSSIVPVNVS